MEKIDPRKFISGDNKIYHGFRKSFIQNGSISLEARFILVLLMTYKGKNENCWPSQGTLGKNINRSRRTVSKYLKELERRGFLKISSRGYGRSLLYSPNYLPVQKVNTKPAKTATQRPTQTITARSIDSENIDSYPLRKKEEGLC